MYIVRSGLAKVIENVGAKLREQDFAPIHWAALRRELAAAALPAARSSSSCEAALRRRCAVSAGRRRRRGEAIVRRQIATRWSTRSTRSSARSDVPKQFGKTTQDAVAGGELARAGAARRRISPRRSRTGPTSSGGCSSACAGDRLPRRRFPSGSPATGRCERWRIAAKAT